MEFESQQIDTINTEQMSATAGSSPGESPVDIIPISRANPNLFIPPATAGNDTVVTGVLATERQDMHHHACGGSTCGMCGRTASLCRMGSGFVPINIQCPVVGEPRRLKCASATHWFHGTLNDTLGEFRRQAVNLIREEAPEVSPSRVRVFAGHVSSASSVTSPSVTSPSRTSSSTVAPSGESWGDDAADHAGAAPHELVDDTATLAHLGVTIHLAVQKRGLVVRIDPEVTEPPPS